MSEEDICDGNNNHEEYINIDKDYNNIVKLVSDIYLNEKKMVVNGKDKLIINDKIVKIALDKGIINKDLVEFIDNKENNVNEVKNIINEDINDDIDYINILSN